MGEGKSVNDSRNPAGAASGRSWASETPTPNAATPGPVPEDTATQSGTGREQEHPQAHGGAHHCPSHPPPRQCSHQGTPVGQVGHAQARRSPQGPPRAQAAVPGLVPVCGPGVCDCSGFLAYLVVLRDQTCHTHKQPVQQLSSDRHNTSIKGLLGRCSVCTQTAPKSAPKSTGGPVRPRVP